MARGWESKAVESAQADRERAREASSPAPGQDRAGLADRQTLELARQRAMAELQLACRPAHRAMLEATIEDLDRRLAAFSSTGPSAR